MRKNILAALALAALVDRSDCRPVPAPARQGGRSLQFTPQWLANAVMGTSFVKAGMEGSNPLYVCRALMYDGQYYAGKRGVSACNVAINGTEYVAPLSTNQMLVADSSMAWATYLPNGASSIVAGPNNAGPQAVCRAYHPIVGSGPHAGYVITGSDGNPACIFSYGGKNVTVATPAFHYLFSMSTGFPPDATLVVPSPSATPSNFPSATPSPTALSRNAVLWLNVTGAAAQGYNYHHYMKAGSESGFDIFACRAVLPNGRGTIAGKWETQWSFCDVPLDQTEFNDADYQLLITSPYIAWASYPLPAGARVLVAGIHDNMPSVLCRAYHPIVRSGPHAGYTSFSGASLAESEDDTPTCLISYGGGVLALTDFQIVVQLPSSIAALGKDSTGAWNGSTPLLLPSASPMRSPSPTSTASPVPVVPGQIQWWNYTQGAMQSGMDGTKPVYVCRGYLPGGEIVPGKFLEGFTFCDVPWHNVEYVDTTFEALRYNPWLAWNATVPASGQVIVAGSHDNVNLKVCRAYHPTLRSGPHAGYTDDEDYNGAKLCFFSYGGKIVRTAPFEYLYMGVAPSASPSPATQSTTPSPQYISPSGTASALASLSASGSAASSASPSAAIVPLSPSGTAAGTSAATPSTTATPSSTGTATGAGTPASSPVAAQAATTAKATVKVVDDGSTAVNVMVGIIVALSVGAGGFYMYKKRKADKAHEAQIAAIIAGASTTLPTTNERAPIISETPSADPWVVNDPRFQYTQPSRAGTSAHV